MRYKQLIESEDSDREDRAEAEDLFDRLREWLSQNVDQLSERLTRSDSLNGCWALQAKVLGSHWDDLIIIFAPRIQHNGSTMRGSFGHAGTRPVIVLTVLKAPYDLQYLETRIVGSHETFVHEYQHYLAWKRNKRPSKTSPEVLGDGDYTAYYNHAEELNSFYQEAVAGFARLVKNVIRLGHADHAWKQWGSLSTPELVKDIIDNHMDDDFVENLTPVNRRKIEKRLARFVEQSIRPMFVDLA